MRIASLTVSPDTATGILAPFDGNVPYAGVHNDNRLQWNLAETGGARLYVQAPGYEPIVAFAVLPEGDAEIRWSVVQGAEHAHPMDLIQITGGALTANGDRLLRGGRPYKIHGSTEIKLAARINRGEDVHPVLRQRKAAGVDFIRTLAMHLGEGWSPHQVNRADTVRQTVETAISYGFLLHWDVWAGYAETGFSHNEAMDFWFREQEIVWPYREHLVFGLGNELRHDHNRGLQWERFPKPDAAFFSVRGSFGTDEQPPLPAWDGIVGHTRRSGAGTSPKPATNCDPYVYMDDKDWPLPPVWSEESPKLGRDVNAQYATFMGEYANNRCGMIAHTEEGVHSQLWPGHVEVCVRALFEEIR